jgi:hypothetical protein
VFFCACLLGICISPVSSATGEDVSAVLYEMPFETFMQVPFGTDFQLFALRTDRDACPSNLELINDPDVIKVNLGFLQLKPGTWCILVHTRSNGIYEFGDYSYLPMYSPDSLDNAE